MCVHVQRELYYAELLTLVVMKADKSQYLQAKSADGDPGESMCSSNFRMTKNMHDFGYEQ